MPAIVPVALLLHNLEEAITLPARLPMLAEHARHAMAGAVALPSADRYGMVLLVVTAGAFVLLALASVSAGAVTALVVLQAVMALNVLVHVALAALVGGYVPGLATALAVELPASIVVLRTARTNSWLTPRQWRSLPAWAAALHGPGLWLLLRLAGHD